MTILNCYLLFTSCGYSSCHYELLFSSPGLIICSLEMLQYAKWKLFSMVFMGQGQIMCSGWVVRILPTISGVFLSLAELLGSVGFLHNQALKKNEIWHAEKNKNNEILMAQSNVHIYYQVVSPHTYLLRCRQPPAPPYSPIVLLML